MRDPSDTLIYKVLYHYQHNGRLWWVENAKVADDWTTAVFDYDANGNRDKVYYCLKGAANDDLVIVDYTYNRDNLLTAYDTYTAYGTTYDPCFTVQEIAVDGLGRMTGLREYVATDPCSVTWKEHEHDYTYDMMSQLVDASITNINGTTWTADYDFLQDGNIEKETVSGSNLSFSYDGDLLTGKTGYSFDWDENGRCTHTKATDLTWSWESRLRQAVTSSNENNFKYNDDGAMVSSDYYYNQGASNVKTRYIFDNAGDYPQVLLELNANNNNAIAKAYIWANGQLLVQHNGAISSGNQYFYMHDRLGSVRQLIDDDGKVRNRYTYDPYGKSFWTEQTIGVGNPYQFAGYAYHSATGMYHCYQRWYDYQLYRFTGRDPFSGNLEEPYTLHAYLYCLNDPINRIDLTGEFSLAENQGSIAIKSAMYAWTGYSAANYILDNARDFIEGINRYQIAKGLVIDIATNYTAGKALNVLAGGAKFLGKFGKKLYNKWKMGKVRKAGRSGEAASGISSTGKKSIDSLTETAKRRFPDQITNDALIEVKNYSKSTIHFDNQMQDYLYWSMMEGKDFILRVRDPKTLGTKMKKLVEEGFIILQDLKGNPIIFP